MAPPGSDETAHLDEAEHPDAAESIRARMRRGLVEAMKARDQQAVAVLRSALARIDNAEAVDPEAVDDGKVVADVVEDEAVDAGSPPDRSERHPQVAGSVLGVGAAEVDRRVLTSEEVAAVVRDDAEEREIAADVLERVGRPDQAERLRAQAKLLTSYLGSPNPPPSGPPVG